MTTLTATAAPTMQAPYAARVGPVPATGTRRAARGFTLIELMIAVAVAGVLSSIAMPSFLGQVQKARRSDVLVSMLQIQGAQQRFRGYGASYGSLAEIGVPSASTAGYYQLQTTAANADGYTVLATATGAQAGDTTCRYMSLSAAGANVAYASGPDAAVANPTATNRKCWSL